MNIYRLITAFFTHNIVKKIQSSRGCDESHGDNKKVQFNWQDPFLIEQQLTDAWFVMRLMPIAKNVCNPGTIPSWNNRSIYFPWNGRLLGPTIPEQYGGAGLNYVVWLRVKLNMLTQATALWPKLIGDGSDSWVWYRRTKYLPKLATGEYIGCFGLTDMAQTRAVWLLVLKKLTVVKWRKNVDYQ